jgi:hypothetical protein
MLLPLQHVDIRCNAQYTRPYKPSPPALSQRGPGVRESPYWMKGIGKQMTSEVDLARFVTQVTCPQDFADFWQRVRAEADEVPLEPRISPVSMRSNQSVHTYQATYRSLDGLEIAAWYCVPTRGEEPSPAIIHFPGYKGRSKVGEGVGRQRGYHVVRSSAG